MRGINEQVVSSDFAQGNFLTELKEGILMSKKILVALDNSDYAEKVMLQAVEMANAYKASLVGVSVIDDAYTKKDVMNANRG